MLLLSSTELISNQKFIALGMYSPLAKFFFKPGGSLLFKTARTDYWSHLAHPDVRHMPAVNDLSQPKPYFIKENLFSWFKEYWTLHQAKGNYIWTTHADYKLMFLVSMDRRGFYNTMAVSRFYVRWSGGVNLLSNLTFFNASVYAFTSKVFVEEALTFNWNLSYMNYKLFKYAHQLFYFSDSSYGNYTRLSYRFLEQWDVDAALVTDVKSHEKNIFYLTRFGYYTVGLAPANYNPWLLSFPIPLLGDSILGQYYFLVTTLRAGALGRRARFDQLADRWFSLKSLLSTLRL